MLKILVSIILLAFVFAEEKRFDNFSVIRLRISNQKKLDLFFESFPEDTIDIFSHDGGYSTEVDMDILFTPEQVSKLALLYFNKDLSFDKFEVLERNFQNVIQLEKDQINESNIKLAEKISHLKTESEKNKVAFSEEEFYTRYPTLPQIDAYVEDLRRKHENMVKREVIGSTIENRTMHVYTIHAPGAYNNSKPALWINSAQHCREWIAPITGIYSIMKMITTYQTDAQVKAILDKINVFYLPLVNLDGYVFTHNGNRMWRKNRRRNADGRTFGVDLNRNWKSGFGGEGSSGSPSSETYRGPSALSEPESKAISQFLIKHPQITAGIDFHSYSQLNLRPWGKSRAASPDEVKLTALGKKMVDAIESVHKVKYQNIRSAGLYPASGILCDELYENHKQMGYTIELRPTQFGGGGFAPPPSQIKPTAEENYKAVLVVAEYVKTGNI